MFNSNSLPFNFLGEDEPRIIPYCPICESPSQNLEMRILEEKDNGSLVYIKCQKCLNSILTFVTAESHGINSVSLITDLSTSDIMKFKESEAVSSDDVIEVYELLQKEDFFEKLTNS